MLDCEQIHARNLRVPAAVPSRALSAVVSTSRKPKYPPPAPLPTVKTMTNSLLIAIVTDEVSDAALAIAEREGIRGVTILPASGISQSPLRTFFGLTFQSAMTLLFWIADTDTTNRTAQRLNEELDLDSPQQGLALTLTIDQLFGLDLGKAAN